ncbi:MAG: hypothetical protein MZV70_44320 [Desulfobacterales bacterium]|nr:hypothetical protein [Desulfobacterales bacterium]
MSERGEPVLHDGLDHEILGHGKGDPDFDHAVVEGLVFLACIGARRLFEGVPVVVVTDEVTERRAEIDGDILVDGLEWEKERLKYVPEYSLMSL